MLKSFWRTAAMGASALSLFALAACSAPNDAGAPPPPMATEHHADKAPELLGGPPAADQRSFPTMAAIANPRDMSRAERLRVYGHRYDHGYGYGHHHPGYAGGYGGRHHVTSVATTAPTPSVPASVTTPAPAPAVVAAAPTPAPVAAAPVTAVAAAPAAPAVPNAGITAPKFRFPHLSLPSWLSIPGVKMINVPGVSQPVASNNIVGLLILAIAVFLLVMAARGSGSRRHEAPAKKVHPTLGDTPPAAEPAPLPVMQPDAPAAYHSDAYGVPVAAEAAQAEAGHVEPTAVETAHVEPEAAHAEPEHGEASHGGAMLAAAAAAVALPAALAVHFDHPAETHAAEPEHAPVYAEATAPEAVAHEPAPEAVAHPEHVEVLTPETFDWQSRTHPAPTAEAAPAEHVVAEPVVAEPGAEAPHADAAPSGWTMAASPADPAHAEAPEALGHEALAFSDHAIAHTPAPEPEHA